MTKKVTKNKRRPKPQAVKKNRPRDNPVSLAPVDFKDALAGLLATPPDNPKETATKEQPASK